MKRASAQDWNPPAFGYDHSSSYTLPTDCLGVVATKDQVESYIFSYGGDLNGYVTISNKVDFALADIK